MPNTIIQLTNQLSKFDIISKDGHRIPFVVNDFQKKYLTDMTNRDVILKSRQIGFSSVILGLFTLDFLLKDNSRSVCISHDAPSAQKLFDRVKFYIKSAEEKGLAINLKYNSRNEMVNAEKNSSFYIGASGNRNFGRGDTINNVHLSEFAFYDNQEPLMASILQAVVPGGSVIIESTANGVGNYFNTFWDKSKAGETGFTTHFFDNSFYSPEFLEQKLKELGTDLFRQEYPTDDVTAFLMTGTPFFDSETLQWYRTSLSKDPNRQGIINTFVTPPFMDEPTGEWRLWEEPQQGFRYIISTDFAQTSDYSAVAILKLKTQEIVGTFRGRMDARELAVQLSTVGKWYNNALLIPEANGAGLALLNALQDTGYSPIYQRKAYDTASKEPSERLGFLTTMSTRPLMLGELQARIKEKSIKIYDRTVIEEMMSFMRNPKTGRPEAVAGKHDDRVISIALCVRAYQEQAPMMVWEEQNKALYGQDFERINVDAKNKWRI